MKEIKNPSSVLLHYLGNKEITVKDVSSLTSLPMYKVKCGEYETINKDITVALEIIVKNILYKPSLPNLHNYITLVENSLWYRYTGPLPSIELLKEHNIKISQYPTIPTVVSPDSNMAIQAISYSYNRYEDIDFSEFSYLHAIYIEGKAGHYIIRGIKKVDFE